MSRSTCKGCGRPIVWAVVVNDKGERVNVPLDPGAPVYVEVPLKGWKRDKTAMVTHFATCSSANMFSAAKRNPPACPDCGQFGDHACPSAPSEGR